MVSILIALLSSSLTNSPMVNASASASANWQVDDSYQKKKPALMQKIISLAFDSEESAPKKQKGLRTDGIVIIHKNKIIFEKYARGYHKDKRHRVWSISKSFVNALIGIAIDQQLLGLDDSICRHGFKVKCDVTIRSLLEFSSGIKWQETYEKGSAPRTSNVIQMLYGQGKKDIAAYALSLPMQAKPLTETRYSSGDTNILMAVLKNKLKANLRSYIWQNLFEKLDMKSVFWEEDTSGTLVGSSYLFMTPRDLAKFGYLYLKGGKWNGKQILPRQWVHWSTTKNQAADLDAIKAVKLGSKIPAKGKHWWLNLPVTKKQPRIWPSAPKDTFFSSGHWHQAMFVIPSKSLVIVRVGDTKEKIKNTDRLLKLILEFIR